MRNALVTTTTQATGLGAAGNDPGAWRRQRSPLDGDAGSSGMPVDALALLRIMRRNWLLLLAGTLLFGGAAVLWARQQPTRYFSVSTIQLVDRRNALASGIDGADRRGAGGDVSVRSQVAILRSRSIAGAVVDARTLGYRLVPEGFSSGLIKKVDMSAEHLPGVIPLEFLSDGWRPRGGQMPLTPYEAVGTVDGVQLTLAKPPAELAGGMLRILARDQAIDRLQLQLRVDAREQTSLIDVRFTADNPRMAVDALATLLLKYQEADALTAQQQARRRRDFIGGQLRETNALLAEAERKQGTLRNQQMAYSAQEKFVRMQSELTQIDGRRQDLLMDQQMAATLRPQLESADSATRSLALSTLASTSIGGMPGIAALYTELVSRETARMELTSGPRGLAETSPEVQRVDAAISATRRRMVDAVKSYESVVAMRLSALDAQRSAVNRDLQANPSVQTSESMLSQSAEALRQQAVTLRTEFQRAGISEAAEVGQVEIVDPPVRALSLTVPATRVIVFASLLGLLLGVGGALLREALDRTVKTREHVERDLRVPLLATIPRIVPERQAHERASRRLLRRGASEAGRRRQVALASAREFRSSGAESFRHLRTNVLYAAHTTGAKSILVTSPREGEGKTSVSVNLAISLAQQQLRVLLIDCDLMRSRLADMLGCASTPGLHQVLVDELIPHSAVQSTLVSGLWLLPAGAPGDRPIDVAGNLRFRAMLRDLSAFFDVLLLDSAPMLAVADSVAMSVVADGVVLVTRAGRSRVGDMEESLRQLDAVNANVLGAVLNDVDGRLSHRGTSYHYGYDQRPSVRT